MIVHPRASYVEYMVEKLQASAPPAGRIEDVTLDSMIGTALERRVAVAAEQALAQRKYVTVAEVCIGLGWPDG